MLNLSKIRVFKNSAHQEVTGITVNNDTLSIGRRRYKFWRSVLHTIKVK